MLPTLALWGQDDRIVPIEYGFRLRKDVPGVQFFAFPGTGHAPQEELPAETAAKLLAFLATLSN